MMEVSIGTHCTASSVPAIYVISIAVRRTHAHCRVGVDCRMLMIDRMKMFIG